MSGTLTAPGPAPALPAEVLAALRQADLARRDGRIDLAVAALDGALAGLRERPLAAPFDARVLLALTLADTLLAAGRRDRARQLLLDESGYAERIYHLTRISGTPEQRRAAATGRLQVRDRALQLELLGEEAPEIEVAEWVLGAPTTLAELRGRVVLVEFWATWCRPCLAMFPRLRALHAQYAERGLEILALTRYGASPGQPGAAADDPAVRRAHERELVATVVADRGLAIRVGIAPDERLQRRYGAMGVPTLVLVDRAGRVRLIASGGEDAALDAAIEACLAEPAVAPPEDR